MNLLALRMLLGDKARYLGLLIGVSFASLMITQQAGIFVGLSERTYSFISGTSGADLWVMDPEVEHVADAKPMLDMSLYAVRGVDGVEWAVPMYKSFARARLPNGATRGVQLVGMDDATLTGGPPGMAEGSLSDLRETDAIIVDERDVGGKLAIGTRAGKIDRPLRVGDTLELNDRRARVVGVYRAAPGFFWEPTVYTTYSRALTFSPRERRMLTYVLVKVAPGHDVESVRRLIESHTGLAAYTRDGFSMLTASYILQKTGILVNFGIAVGLGFVIGVLITGQTFYNFTVDNIRHFAALKAMGAGDGRVAGMVVLQALCVGAIGYGLGVGGAAVTGTILGEDGGLAFRMPWQLLVFSGGAIAVVCVLAAFLSVRRVLRAEPGMVFKGA